MRLLFLLSCALALTSCDAVSGPFACTEEFVSVTVEVVDSVGRPVEGLVTQSIIERTGEPLASSGAEEFQGSIRGEYVVANDGDARELRVDGDAILFSGRSDDLQASARFVLADDGCHISKEEGPEQIVATLL